MVVYHFADIQAKSEAFENQSCRRVRGKLVLAWLFANLQLPVCYFIHHIIFLTFSVQFSMIFLLFCWQNRNSLERCAIQHCLACRCQSLPWTVMVGIIWWSWIIKCNFFGKRCHAMRINTQVGRKLRHQDLQVIEFPRTRTFSTWQSWYMTIISFFTKFTTTGPSFVPSDGNN